jgi:hypothetical protein
MWPETGTEFINAVTFDHMNRYTTSLKGRISESAGRLLRFVHDAILRIVTDK